MYERQMKDVRVIRDAVHGDIKLSGLETSIVDSPTFQRLRGLKMLGSAYLVFPSAMHTRFEHSLGVFHLARRIADAISGGRKRGSKISRQETILIRLAALLHDLAQIPFSGAFLQRPFASGYHLPSGADVLCESGLRDLIGHHVGSVAAELASVLDAKTERNIKSLAYPYVSDIIRGPLSADMLDYIWRDSFFTGLRVQYDDRILNSFEVSEDGRLAVVLGKDMPWSREVASDVNTVLRARCTLMERVVFHHTVMAGEAMVSRMAEQIWEEKPRLIERLHTLRDYDLLEAGKRLGGTARRLAESIANRRLHKPVYIGQYSTNTGEPSGVHYMERLHSDIGSRRHLEMEIEREFKMPEGSVIISCPPINWPLMAQVPVLIPGAGTMLISEVPCEKVCSEWGLLGQMVQSLRAAHVFLATDHSQKAQAVVRFCYDWFTTFGKSRISESVKISFAKGSKTRGFEKILKAGLVAYTEQESEFIVPKATLEALNKAGIPFKFVK